MISSVRSSWFLACLVAAAACSGDRADPAATAPRASIAPAPVAPAPPKPPLDLKLGDGFEMRHPVKDGRLTIIPIVQTAARSAAVPHYVNLHSAMTRRLVSVRELPDWQVDTVRVKNKSAEPVFAMAGELVIDALQDRIIARDTVIPPHTTVQVAVRCVEQNREKGGRTFHAGNALAELDLRQTAVHQTQTNVWQLVDTINQRLGLTPPTKTYRLAAQQQPVARAQVIAQQLAQLPDHDKLVGLAVAIDGQVIAVDRFATPELYQELEGELLGSYVSSDDGPPHEGHTLVPADVRALTSNSAAVTTTDASFVALQPL